MRRTQWILAGIVLTLLLAACAPQVSEVIPVSPTAHSLPTETPPAAPTQELPAGVRTALAAVIADYQLAPEAVEIEGVVQTDFPDPCLGLARPDELCAAVVTPGVEVTFSAGDQTYVYRADLQGKQAREVQSGEDLAPAVAAARQMLVQQLRVSAQDVKTLRVAATSWPTSCLGIDNAGMACAEVRTAGYVVRLSVKGKVYQYHTDHNGDVILLAEAPEPQTGKTLFSFRSREEPCQAVAVGAEGVAFGPCEGVMMSGFLANPQREEELRHFVETYRSFSAETPAGTLEFTGAGEQKATAVEQRGMAEWVRLAGEEAAGGRSGAAYGLALSWHREGGIAGFCDDLALYSSGILYANSCKGADPQNFGRAYLTSAELEKLYAWLDTYQPLDLEISDNAVADAMTIRLLLNGTGVSEASANETQAMADFASALYQRLAQP
ncbi:MAG: hypothetical protein GYA17_15905 [Chloroflexi bacterium]|nr:hypothetical protein [Chloroflexota bacterium]